jgi:hypothetical protein
MDPIADDFSNEDVCESSDDLATRSFIISGMNETDAGYYELRGLEKRMGKKRKFEIDWTDVAVAFHLIVLSRRYPGSTHLHDATRSPSASDLAFR